MTILVTAATKHGATAEIAEAIGRALETAGHVVTVEAVDCVTSVEPYEAVILGSGVYIGHWLAPARAFAHAHGEDLRARPTWLFSSGPIGAPPLPKAEDAVDVDDLMQETGARDHRLFGGRVDRHRLGFAERAVLLAVRAQDGDYRDWEEISAWAGGIAAELVSMRGRAADQSASPAA
jgi:menaquinone-dependent protoporphyrinogen oxidase